jgi:lipopolysaccharide export system permease protein
LPFVAVGGVLTAIFTTYSMTRFLDKAADGLLRTSEVLQLTALKSVIAQEVLIPVSLFVALVIALGRLYSDWEMTALRSFGFAEQRILLPILSVAAALAVVVALFSLVGRPWAYDQLYRLEVEAEATSGLDRIKPGRFYFYDEDARTVFIEDVPVAGDQITGLFIRSLDGDDVEIISAPEGTVREFVTAESHELDLRNAQIYRRSNSGSDFLGLFKRLRILVPVGAVQPVGYKPKSQNSFVLRESDQPADQAEYQWRLSTPISTVLLALLAVPLGRSRPRQGRFARLTLAVIIYAVYFNVLGISRTWVEQGTALTLWWVPLTFAAAISLAYLPWPRIAHRLSLTR